MLCKKCGCEIPDGSKVCSYCGTETAILKEEKKRKAKKFTQIGCLGCVGLVALLMLIGSCSSDKNKIANPEKPIITEQGAIQSSEKLTKEELRARFNELAYKYDTNQIITIFNEDKKGDQNTFGYVKNDIIYTVILKEDGTVKRFTVTATEQRIDSWLIGVAMAIRAVNPGVTEDQAVEIINKMSQGESVMQNNVTYEVSTLDSLKMIMFTAEIK